MSLIVWPSPILVGDRFTPEEQAAAFEEVKKRFDEQCRPCSHEQSGDDTSTAPAEYLGEMERIRRDVQQEFNERKDAEQDEDKDEQYQKPSESKPGKKPKGKPKAKPKANRGKGK